jgi:hypothetical protein
MSSGLQGWMWALGHQHGVGTCCCYLFLGGVGSLVTWHVPVVVQLLLSPTSSPFPARCGMVVLPSFVVCHPPFIVPGTLAGSTHNPPCEQWPVRLEAGTFVDGPSASTRDPPHEQWLVRLDVGAVVGPALHLVP